jgi:hypothetical protein
LEQFLARNSCRVWVTSYDLYALPVSLGRAALGVAQAPFRIINSLVTIFGNPTDGFLEYADRSGLIQVQQ